MCEELSPLAYLCVAEQCESVARDKVHCPLTVQLYQVLGMNRATQLRKEIRDAWSHMEIPVLPPPVTTECFEFPFTMFVGAGDDSVLARTGFADYRYTHDAQTASCTKSGPSAG